MGIDSSAIATSNSAELRKSIRNFALEEGKLLDSIGTAEVQKVIEDRASRMYVESQKHMEEEIGFTPLTKAEVTKHIEIVMKELEEAKARKGKGG